MASVAGTSTTRKVVSRSFTSIGDAHVRQDQATTNFGKTAELRIDGSPQARAYIRFRLYGVAGTIDFATLKVFALTTTGDGFRVHGASGHWSESGVTFANSPAVGVLIGPSGSMIQRSWVSVDVSRLVRSASRAVNIALIANGETSFAIASREQRRLAPQLIVESTP